MTARTALPHGLTVIRSPDGLKIIKGDHMDPKLTELIEELREKYGADRVLVNRYAGNFNVDERK